MNNTVLITGGLGYVGGRVASHLKKFRPEVKLIITTRRSLNELPDWASGLDVRRMEMRDRDAMQKALDGVDTIVHLAAVNEIDALREPLSALDVNAGLTFGLLDSAVASGVKKFIYFSTYHVYDPRLKTQVAEKSPTRPKHPYAISHLAAEGFVDYFNQYKKIKTMIFRLSNAYGYPMDSKINRWKLVFNDLCRQAVLDGKIVLKTSGRQCRDFISLEDVARAVDHFLFVAPESWDDGLFNLGGRCSMSILDVANKINSVYQKLYRKSPLTVEISNAINDEENVFPVEFSVEKLQKTGFSFEGDMDHEIERTLKIAEELKHV